MSRFSSFLRVPLGLRFTDFSKVLLGSQFGVPQGSVLGTLLSNIDMINLFYECGDSNNASHADDTTPNSSAINISGQPLQVQPSATKRYCWLKNNHLKANPGKSHILLSTNRLEIVSIDGIPLAASSHEKLLGVTIDSQARNQEFFRAGEFSWN